MCGKIAERLYCCLIEGSELNVCENCARFGKIIKKPIKNIIKKKVITKPEKEIIQIVKEDYAAIIRSKREKLGLKQKEFAVKLSEKESLIQKIETSQIKPSLKLAKKLERFLNVELIEQIELKPETNSSDKNPGKLTIGDMIKLK
ncbi:TIGR00270 family protein [Candidatus Woesearchaeota archaeon]|nr:TIGR00270 family protein [Candidatus Woesearchaeota archaeon]